MIEKGKTIADSPWFTHASRYKGRPARLVGCSRTKWWPYSAARRYKLTAEVGWVAGWLGWMLHGKLGVEKTGESQSGPVGIKHHRKTFSKSRVLPNKMENCRIIQVTWCYMLPQGPNISNFSVKMSGILPTSQRLTLVCLLVEFMADSMPFNTRSRLSKAAYLSRLKGWVVPFWWGKAW